MRPLHPTALVRAPAAVKLPSAVRRRAHRALIAIVGASKLGFVDHHLPLSQPI
jgi:hypothetical protein